MWTEERTATTVKMWADGYSASQIANEIGGGKSRSAVIGKVHRLKLPGRATLVSFSPPRKEKPPKLPRLPKAPPLVPEAIPEPVAPPSSNLKVSFFNLGNNHCRYPLWSDGTPFADQFYCGGPQADVCEGRSFCPFHQRITRRSAVAA